MVAWMPELRAGADTRRLGIVPKFLQLANNFTIYPSTRRGLSLWIWRPLPHNSEIQHMSDSTDECKECSSLGTIVNCEVSLTVCGERWQNGCPLMVPRSFNFLPSARDRESWGIYFCGKAGSQVSKSQPGQGDEWAEQQVPVEAWPEPCGTDHCKKNSAKHSTLWQPGIKE